MNFLKSLQQKKRSEAEAKLVRFRKLMQRAATLDDLSDGEVGELADLHAALKVEQSLELIAVDLQKRTMALRAITDLPQRQSAHRKSGDAYDTTWRQSDSLIKAAEKELEALKRQRGFMDNEAAIKMSVAQTVLQESLRAPELIERIEATYVVLFPDAVQATVETPGPQPNESESVVQDVAVGKRKPTPLF